MKRLNKIFMVGTALLVSGLAGAGDPLAYPEGYRLWTHVKSMVIKPGHPLENPFQGIHHIYANFKARNGYQSGHFPDGSVIVFDLLEYSDQDNTLQEGKRKLIGVMHRDSQRHVRTGGWGFEAFAGDSKTQRLVDDGGVSCFNCHASEKAHEYVFSRFRK